jgi:hypothetical protein
MPKRIFTIEAINKRLKETGVQLEQRGNKLSLRATLPARVGTGRKQARVSLNLSALVPLELEQAEAKAWELAAQKAQGRFRWEDWSQEKAELERMTAADWVEKYRVYRASQGVNNDNWKRHYWTTYKKLPIGQPLTEANILGVVLQSVPNSRTRKHDCMRLKNLAEYAELAVNLAPYLGNYSPKKTKPRELPADEEIVRARERFLVGRIRIEARRWQNAYSLMACYGLRPHEVFYCEVDSLPPHACNISEGKTGSRTAMPLYPEWAVEWKLWEVELPQTVAQTHWSCGQKVCNAMQRYIDFPPYNLRHCYALRGSVKFKIPIRVMAGMMGHTPEIHLATYSKYLKDSQALEVYLAIAEKEDRPKPPTSQQL